MNGKILEILKENNGIYVSGEDLSKVMNVSRAAIWKHINAIKEIGYVIDSVPKKGYKLISSPDILTYEEVNENLNTKYIGKTIIHLNQVESTNTYAKQIGDTCADGTVVSAEEQTLGRGRMGKVWQSKGGSLCMSIVLKPDISPFQVAKLTQVCAAAVYTALAEIGIECQIKWPNDLLIDNKKICGILTEMNAEMNKINYIVLGIGLNVNNPCDDFDDEVKKIATSIMIETGEMQKKKVIMAKLLNHFEVYYDEFIKNGNFEKSLKVCKEKSSVLNKYINLIKNGEKIKAKAIDINEKGELVVEYENGLQDIVISGEISVRVI